MSNDNDGYDLFEKINSRFDELKDCYHDLDKKSEVTLSRLEDHFEQDSKNLANITQGLELINERLDTYNSELSIHIQGVMELRRANQLLQEKIELERRELERKLSEEKKVLEIRLEGVESPWKWLSQTGNVLKFIASLSAAGGVIALIAKMIQKYL
jgi:hypothetical protein